VVAASGPLAIAWLATGTRLAKLVLYAALTARGMRAQRQEAAARS